MTSFGIFVVTLALCLGAIVDPVLRCGNPRPLLPEFATD